MRVAWALAGTVLSVFTLACAPTDGADGAPESPATRGAVDLSGWPGCYTLGVEDEGWRIPEAVALDSVPLEGWERFAQRYDHEVFRARSFETKVTPPRDTPFAYWRPLASDTVELGHPRALAGMTVRLGRGRGGLSGTVVAFTDVMTPEQSARDSSAVRASRIPCRELSGVGGG